jgi:iron complex transport system permease protein
MNKKVRFYIVLTILIIFLIFSIVINIVSGSVDFTIKDLIDITFNDRELSTLEYNILYKIRIPRIIAAMLFGGALAISGFLLQTFFKNPIVGPYVLGISSGAKLFVGIFILTNFNLRAVNSGEVSIFIASLVGSLIAMVFVLLVARNVEDISALVVVGIMFGYITSAGTNLMITFAEQEKIASLAIWSMGSFSGVTWNMVKLSTVIILPTLVLTFCISKPLEGYLLGESYAKSIGINIKAFRIILVFLSSIFSACVTAFAGPISFVGIAVPHLVRMIIKSSQPKLLIPCIFLLGSSFCLLSDYFSRTIFSPIELNISTVTSFIGAPIVIYLMINRRKRI